MRAVIIVALVAACGSKPAEREVDTAAAKLDALATKMCACKSKECAQQVNEEMTAWAAELDRTEPEGKASLDMQNRMTEALNRYSRCLNAAIRLP